jgi:hypothetical protein
LTKAFNNFMSEALTIQESSRLKQLEKVIKTGEKTFIEVGEALTEIRDSKLYRAEHGTFEKYCERTWGWSRKNSYAIMNAAPVAKCNPGVTNVKAALALKSVPPPKRPGIVAKIVAAGQKVTAAAIKNACPPPQKPTRMIQTDGTGLEIPREVESLWSRMPEAQDLLTKLSAIRGALRKAQEDKDILFVEVDFTDSLAKLNQVFVDLQRAKPYAVCPTCQGKLPKGCLLCKGRGLISQFCWENQVPEETRNMRS